MEKKVASSVTETIMAGHQSSVLVGDVRELRSGPAALAVELIGAWTVVWRLGLLQICPGRLERWAMACKFTRVLPTAGSQCVSATHVAFLGSDLRRDHHVTKCRHFDSPLTISLTITGFTQPDYRVRCWPACRLEAARAWLATLGRYRGSSFRGTYT
jgi:hypothetical protein